MERLYEQGLHGNVMGELVNLCSIIEGFYVMGLHAQVIGEYVKLCSIIRGFLYSSVFMPK